MTTPDQDPIAIGLPAYLRLMEKNADERHEATTKQINEVKVQVRDLGRRVDGIQTKVETVAAAQSVAEALADAEGMDANRKFTSGLSRKNLIVMAIGVGGSYLIGIATLTVMLFAGTGAH